MPKDKTFIDSYDIIQQIQNIATNLGLQQIGITDIELQNAAIQLTEWLEHGWHGQMQFMARHYQMRSHPAELLPGTKSIISAQLNYLSLPILTQTTKLTDPNTAYIANYALGRDYHRLFRKRLQQLAKQIINLTGPFKYRVYVDSAPVMEKPLAAKAGLGWIGKHTNLVNRNTGSWFFLGEIYTDLSLPTTMPASNHCGSCQTCIAACPTGAIIAPYKLDARRCIAYLTIEEPGVIPITLRSYIGNRIFGCDDCQHVCPWNRFAAFTTEPDFKPRSALHPAQLIDLFAWSEAEFLKYTEGSAIRRLGWIRWLRNIAIALGNAPPTPEIIAALQRRLIHPNALVQHHVEWALAQHIR